MRFCFLSIRECIFQDGALPVYRFNRLFPITEAGTSGRVGDDSVGDDQVGGDEDEFGPL